MGIRAKNELVGGDKGIMDIDYTDKVFDDVGAEVESPVARIPRGECIHHIVGLLIH